MRRTLRSFSSSPNTTQSTARAGRAYSYVKLIASDSPFGFAHRDERTHVSQRALEAARQEREATPRARVDVAIVEVERRRDALALPQVLAPLAEEPLDPRGELSR